ncbi:MAG: hypothetical protein Q8K58_00420 [Acidimicrobiales bacterium]|nr:hypothetical protein [Acidimicrobiales bacterium]
MDTQPKASISSAHPTSAVADDPVAGRRPPPVVVVLVLLVLLVPLSAVTDTEARIVRARPAASVPVRTSWCGPTGTLLGIVKAPATSPLASAVNVPRAIGSEFSTPLITAPGCHPVDEIVICPPAATDEVIVVPAGTQVSLDPVLVEVVDATEQSGAVVEVDVVDDVEEVDELVVELVVEVGSVVEVVLTGVLVEVVVSTVVDVVVAPAVVDVVVAAAVVEVVLAGEVVDVVTPVVDVVVGAVVDVVVPPAVVEVVEPGATVDVVEPGAEVEVVPGAVVVVVAPASTVQVTPAGSSPGAVTTVICAFQYLSSCVGEADVPIVQAIPTLYAPAGMSPGENTPRLNAGMFTIGPGPPVVEALAVCTST